MKPLLFATFFIAIQSSYAQELNIGDPIPSREIRIDNYSEESINLSELKGKFIILDFWDHGCISCLQSFRKMDSLQKLFADKVQIILINNESSDSTTKFFSKRKKLKIPQLPRISGDSLLSELFPHHYVPYHIWIDTTGIIRFKADGSMATVENIEAFMKGTLAGASYVYKEIRKQSLFDSAYLKNLEQYSYLSHWIPDIRLVSSIKKGFIQRTFNCVSIVDLYKAAYNNSYASLDNIFNRPGRVVLEVNDSIKYIRPKNGVGLTKWLESYSYNYQILIPERKTSEMFKIMLSDLDRYFELKVSVERRNISSLVLVRTSEFNKLRTKGSETKKNFTWADERTTHFDLDRGFTNYDYTLFKKEFRNYVEFISGKPFVDATGFNEKIDISFPGSALDSHDLSQIRKQLKKFDLALVEANWPLDVLIIREK